MQYEWDDAKEQANLAKHGMAFSEVVAFDWNTAMQAVDERADYGETRWIALGLIGTRVHVLIYTRREQAIRVISLRKANRREVRRYEQAQTGSH